MTGEEGELLEGRGAQADVNPWTPHLQQEAKAARESSSPRGQEASDIISHAPQSQVRRKVIALDGKHDTTRNTSISFDFVSHKSILITSGAGACWSLIN